MEFVIVRRLLQQWFKSPTTAGWPLSARDWLAVYWSAIFYSSRVALGILHQLSTPEQSSGENGLSTIQHCGSAA
jgi:hypothetical protein